MINKEYILSVDMAKCAIYFKSISDKVDIGVTYRKKIMAGFLPEIK